MISLRCIDAALTALPQAEHGTQASLDLAAIDEPRWALLTLAELWDGSTRFNEIRQPLRRERYCG